MLILLLLQSPAGWGQGEDFPDPTDTGTPVGPPPLFLDSSCVVSVLNRTTVANDDGTWILPTVPANFGPVRARATCVRNGATLYGQSDLFTLGADQSLNLPDILLGSVAPVPQSIQITAAAANLTTAAQTSQLTAIATYSDGSTLNISPGSSGVEYRVSNPAIATVSPDGLVTAIGSGTAVVQAVLEGAQGETTLQVTLSIDSDGDGIPDDAEIRLGLNPHDPTDALLDPDHDGLTNLQEYQLGTDPHNPDTDGDGLTDGQEVLLYHTNPLLASTDGSGIPDGIEVETGTLGAPLAAKISAALASIEVKPANFLLTVNTIQGEASQQLAVTGHLIDGKTTINLTSTQDGTKYSSSDLTICNFAPPDGNIFAGNQGGCTITVTNGLLTAQANGIVNAFSPTPLGFVAIPGFANSVAVNGNLAYVAAGGAGLRVVSLSDRTAPTIVSALTLAGNANDVKLMGNTAFVAGGSAGLEAVDISNPSAPVVRSTLSTSGTALDITISGNTAYVANSSGLFLANISNPATMTPIASLGLAGTIRGVAVDPQRSLALVAAGTSGVYIVDVSNPTAPVQLSQIAISNAHQVAIKGNYAYVANYQPLGSSYVSSLVSVDISNPASPLIVSAITDETVGGNNNDIVLANNFALTADVIFVNGIPITDITDPTNLISRAVLNFPQRDDNGMGIAADSTYVYLTTDHDAIDKFGTSGDGRLYIGQFQQIQDTFGIPPTVTITSPAPGGTVIQGSSVAVIANATDDIAVAGVGFQVNGQTVFTTTTAPYQYSFTVPANASTVTIGATATDLGDNVGTATNIALNVIPDPGTTVTGRILYRGAPVTGATVTANGGSPVTTGADGTFSIAGIPTVSGLVSVNAEATITGTTLARSSAPMPPVVGGITSVGDIDLDPGYVVVTNTTDVTVSIIDPASLSVVATVPIPGETNLYGVSVTSNRKVAAVAGVDIYRDFSDIYIEHSDIFYIGLTGGAPAITSASTVSTGNIISAVATTSDGQFAVAGNDFVGSFNIGTQALLSRIDELSIYQGGLAITPDNRTVLAVSANAPGYLDILHLDSTGYLTDTGISPLPSNTPAADSVVVAPNGRFALWYTPGQGVYVLRIDSAGNVTVDSTVIPVNSQGGVAFTPDGSKAYLTQYFTGIVAVLNIDSQDHVTDSGIRIPLGTQLQVPNNGTQPITIAADGRAFVVTYSTNAVIAIDTATNTVLATIPVGKGPLGIGSAH
jgi:YVTN family beta-propeller protein